MAEDVRDPATRVQHPGGGESRTKQADLERSDINKMMAKWNVHGVPPPVGRQPTYGDFTGAADFHDAMNKVKEAEDQFLKLPARLRKYVDNDPGMFLDLVNDPDRHDELVDLGLVDERDPSTPDKGGDVGETPPQEPVPEG